MAATVAFADLGNLAGAGFPNVSEMEDRATLSGTRNQL